MLSRSRTFGVEIECLVPMGRREFYENTREVRNREFPDWDFKEDGSLDYYMGIEVTTPILVGSAGLKELKKGMKFLRDHGAYVERSCGMHVHHGVPELFDFLEPEVKKKIFQILDSWMENQERILNFVNVSRHRNGYCHLWTETTRDYLDRNLNEMNELYGGRRAISFDSIATHGTIEIRLHEGTLDFDEASSWIEFGQKFIESCLGRAKPIKRVSNSQELFRRVRIAKTAERKLAEKERMIEAALINYA